MMKGQRKNPKIPGSMRGVVATNVQHLMDTRYADSNNRPKALARDSGVFLSTVQRVLKQEVGATLDTIEALAKAFGIAPHQLLMHDLAATNPRILRLVSKGEPRLRARPN